MSDSKRATIYFDPALHRALRLKSVETERSISELVNEAVRQSLTEDADDLSAFQVRERERSLSFEEVVQDMRDRGEL